jgi:hypothetical protein
MTPAPKRRWLRFSLRTFLVVLTVLACWLGYYVNWIHQRRIVVENTEVAFSKDFVRPRDATTGRRNRRSHIAPHPLNWFGENGYWCIQVKAGTSDAEIARVRRLFPEAQIEIAGNVRFMPLRPTATTMAP